MGSLHREFAVGLVLIGQPSDLLVLFSMGGCLTDAQVGALGVLYYALLAI